MHRSLTLWMMLVAILAAGCATGCSSPMTTAQADKLRDEESITMSTGTTYGKKTGWGTSGTLTTGRKDRSVSIQADFERAGPATTYTISFGKSNNPASNNPIFAEALITWAVEGNYVSRRVTIADGTSISGVGQAVKVILTDNTQPAISGNPLFDPVVPADYSVSVQLAPGVRGADEQPPTLVPHAPDPTNTTQTIVGNFENNGFYGVDPGKTVALNVPQDAGAKSLFVTVITPGENEVHGNLRVVHVYQGVPVREYDPRDFSEWVPLVPGVDQVWLTSDASVLRTAFFGVTFGIEG